MTIPAKITTRNEPAGWVAEVVTLEFGRCVYSTEPKAHEHRALEDARLWVLNHRRWTYSLQDAEPKGGLTVDLFDLADDARPELTEWDAGGREDFDTRR